MHKTLGQRDPALAFPLAHGRDDADERRQANHAVAVSAIGLDADPALEEIGRIVHEADLADDHYDAPAAVGLDVLIRGLTLTSGSDHDTLAITDRLFDGLDLPTTGTQPVGVPGATRHGGARNRQTPGRPSAAPSADGRLLVLKHQIGSLRLRPDIAALMTAARDISEARSTVTDPL